MCGIAIVVDRSQRGDAATIERMVDAIVHRGPDSRGSMRSGDCALGHTRLQVLDLATGSQPLSDESGRFWISYNGELYNYREIREDLLNQGLLFHTQSDTEVVVNAYRAWGAEALDRFRGMFAFAIWDSRERALFAARDLFGERPLYFATASDGALLLASEIKALLASGRVSDAIDAASLDAYLSLGYIPPDRTAYRNIHTLPAAHFLRWKEGSLTIHRYWTPRLDTTKIDLADAAIRLDELMSRSVRQQMIADVEVGAFLSGGVDSSSIVALAQAGRKGNKALKTFSVGFGDTINELPYARAVAQMYGTSHHEIDLADAPVASLVEEIAAVYDEPFGDSSCIPTYEIARYARQFVKVVLTGDGADELFAGYERHATVVDVGSIAMPRMQWLVLSAARRMMPHSRLISENTRRARLATWADSWKRCLMIQLIFGARERARLWNGRRRSGEVFRPETAISTPEGGSDLSRALYFDLTTYLPGDLLVKVDRAAMAHGLETRAPFLDRDVAEFALSLPDALKLSGGQSKVILRTAFAGRWPEAIRSRQKQGFQAPVREWLERPDMQPLLARVFTASSELSHLLPGIARRKQQRDLGTWNLMMLGLWLQRRNTGSRV